MIAKISISELGYPRLLRLLFRQKMDSAQGTRIGTSTVTMFNSLESTASSFFVYAAIMWSSDGSRIWNGFLIWRPSRCLATSISSSQRRVSVTTQER